MCLGYGTKGSVGLVCRVVLSGSKAVRWSAGVVVEFYRDSAAWSKVRYGKGHKTERIVVGTICQATFFLNTSPRRFGLAINFGLRLEA